MVNGSSPSWRAVCGLNAITAAGPGLGELIATACAPTRLDAGLMRANSWLAMTGSMDRVEIDA
jgi:hypothetical protein